MKPSVVSLQGTKATLSLCGCTLIVDEGSLPLLLEREWSLMLTQTTGPYFVTRQPPVRRNTYLHRLIVAASPGDLIDHRDGDTLNNRRSNLRFATPSQNVANSRKQRRRTSSQYKGVYCEGPRTFEAACYFQGKRVFRAFFNNERAAALSYDAVARVLWGEHACVNFPRKDERGCRAESRVA